MRKQNGKFLFSMFKTSPLTHMCSCFNLKLQFDKSLASEVNDCFDICSGKQQKSCFSVCQMMSVFWAMRAGHVRCSLNNTLDWIPVDARGVVMISLNTVDPLNHFFNANGVLGKVNASSQTCVCLFCCRWTRRRWRDWCCSIHTSCSVQWCRTVSERWNELIRWAGAPTHPRPPNTHTHTHTHEHDATAESLALLSRLFRLPTLCSRNINIIWFEHKSVHAHKTLTCSSAFIYICNLPSRTKPVRSSLQRKK